jgi:hypothetical protein
MNVFDIINEALPAGWSLTQDGANGAWQAKDPSGTVRASGKIKGNVLNNAEKWVAQNPGATNTTAQNQPATDSPEDKPKDSKDKPKVKGKGKAVWEKIKNSRKWLFNKGGLVGAVLGLVRVGDAFSKMIDDYVRQGCDHTSWDFRRWTKTLNMEITKAVSMWLAAAAGSAAASMATAGLIAGIGGPAGWIAGAVIALGGAAVSIWLAELADESTGFTTFVAELVTDYVVKDWSGFAETVDDILEEIGFDLISCRESAGVPLDGNKSMLIESLNDAMLIKETSAANGMKQSALKAINANPKLKAALNAKMKDPKFKEKAKSIVDDAKAKAS